MNSTDTTNRDFNILIVDDSPNNVLLVKKIVENAGYSTTTAPDGETALELFEERSFDLVLLDIMMPGIDGFEVCRRMQEGQRRQLKVPVIFLTSVTNPASIVRGFELGAVDFINKPIISEVLIARVETHLELSRQRKRLEQQATIDELTQLLNRRGFITAFQDRLHFHRRTNMMAALLFIDLDHFKNINDSMGHDAGDDLLQKVSEIFKDLVRETDIIGRFGGDEFVIGLLDLKSPEDAAFVSNKIIKEVSKPFIIKDTEVFIGTSIGISLFPEDAEKLGDLIKYGDSAMYQAKKAGKNCYTFYETKMEEAAKRKLLLDSRLHYAIENNEFILLYQPQVHSGSGELFGAEVLIRWKRPEQGMISPVEFIPIAEKNGLIVPIGEYVLREACRQTKYWHDNGHNKIKISVNFSVKQFLQRNIVDVIKNTLAETGLAPEYLNIEITESLLMNNIQQTIDKLQELRELGIESSIDDFGTGYSSLSYLQQLPVAHLKIDKAFVDNVNDDATIASAIVNLGQNLSLHVIAEGIEHQEQNEKLMELGCQLAQGYLFGKPMSASEFEEYCAK
jgi:diguanylate cyclase (GGDEF)-like protein